MNDGFVFLFEDRLRFGHALVFKLLGQTFVCEAGFPFGYVLPLDGLHMFVL